MSVRQSILRPAVIVGGLSGTDQTCTIQYTDRPDGRSFTCTIPHPFSSTGWGVLVTPTIGTRVIVGQLQNERPWIVATIPLNQFSQDFEDPENIIDISVDDIPYPVLEPGEIGIQSASGSLLHFSNDGSVRLRVGDIKIDYSNLSIADEQFVSRYVNLESCRQISGLIKRDLREAPSPNESTFDRLLEIDNAAEASLQQVGRNPILGVAPLTFGSTIRNPGLVEHHEIIYEFQRTHMAGTYQEEIDRASSFSGPQVTDSSFLSQNSRRDMSRTDILNLGLNAPNSLLETVAGTVVDIYGNVLDINRHVIDYNGAFSSAQGDLRNVSPNQRIDIESKLLRRSIKYHFEINARKEPGTETDADIIDGVSLTDLATQTGYSKSRFSVDVDGEGLTKINIPSTSNYGNIPLLARYVNAHDINPKNRNDWSFRNNPRVDVQHLAFGNVEGDGIDLTGTYKPSNQKIGGKEFRVRTAYHDLINTASQARDLTQFPDFPIVGFLSNDFTDTGANAGGRSLHVNLDGSLELNVGRDVADKKSIVLDTAGSIISRIGKDGNNHSVVSQLDGHVAIQVGGDAVRGETPEGSNIVKFFVKGSGGYHQIEINEKGIFITSAPDSNIVMQSQNNLILSAIGQVLINGETISNYGKYSNNGNTIVAEQLVQRTGKALG